MQSWSAPEVPELPGRGERVHLHDSRTGSLVPTSAVGPATLYVCGITPYDATHLGHASTYVGFDLLVRAWLDGGREVRYAQNVTDVDDPLLERAAATGVDWRELAAEQIDLFRSDMTALRVVPPTHYVGAVESIALVVEAVEEMLGRGTAYRVPTGEDDANTAQPSGGAPDGDVYADLSQDALFGTGSHLGARERIRVFADNGGDPDRPGKRHPLDPLLWRRHRPGEPFWPGGTLGPGRPGWHVECAAIALRHLGAAVEVQGGGRDLIFPHHEMSESHLRVLTGRPHPVAVHSHGGMVGCGGQKMSKSLGNLVLVSRLLAEGTDPMVVRLALLAHHYRADWEYSTELLTAAEARLRTWRAAAARGSGPAAEPVLAAVRTALAADLDSPAALAAVDAWAAAALAGEGGRGQAGELVARTVDALLGVAL